MSNPITQGKIDAQSDKLSLAWFGSAGWKNRRDAGVTGNSVIIITLRQRLVNPFRPGVR